MWGLATLLVGGLYGWMAPGLQNKGRVLWTGVVLGLVVGALLALFGGMIGSAPLGLGLGVQAGLLSAVVMAGLFIVGTWAGDAIQRHRATAN